MKTLYLLRHAKSSWGDGSLDDFDRPLNKRGRRSVPLIAQYMRTHRLAPDAVLCSAAVRARATLDGIMDALSEADVHLERALYGARASDLLDRLHAVDDEAGSVMLIGHNPSIQALAVALAADHDAPLYGELRAKFPTGALAVLSGDIAHWRELAPRSMRLDAFVRPRDLEAAA